MLTPAPIYQSLTRPLQVAGAERTYAIVVIGATALLGVLGWYFHSIPCAIAAVLLNTTGMLFLRRVAKKDPHGIEVARRFYAYKAYYPARSAPRPPPRASLSIAASICGGLLALLVAWLMGSLLIGVLGVLALLVGGGLKIKAAR